MIFIPLIFLCINVQAQTIINVDSSNTINIYNNGTLIENNQGTVNIGTESGKDEELRMPDDLGKVTEPKDKNVHFIYTDDYKFAGDKVKIKGKVYKNVNIMKSISGEKLFKIIGNEAYGYDQTPSHLDLSDFDTYIKGNVLYVSKYKNCNDVYVPYAVIDGLNKPWTTIHSIDLVGEVVVEYETSGDNVRSIAVFILVILLMILIFG